MLLVLWAGGCSSAAPGRLFDASHGAPIDSRAIEWSEAERAAQIAVLEVRRGNWSSEHMVRLAGAEKPHVHQRHDVVVTLLSGRVRMHLGDRVFEMRAGDVANIPHGTSHWAENLVRGGASTAYAIFTPPYDGQDNEPAKP